MRTKRLEVGFIQVLCRRQHFLKLGFFEFHVITRPRDVMTTFPGTSGKHFQTMLEASSAPSTSTLVSKQMNSNNPQLTTSPHRFSVKTYKHRAIQVSSDGRSALLFYTFETFSYKRV